MHSLLFSPCDVQAGRQVTPPAAPLPIRWSFHPHTEPAETKPNQSAQQNQASQLLLGCGADRASSNPTPCCCFPYSSLFPCSFFLFLFFFHL